MERHAYRCSGSVVNVNCSSVVLPLSQKRATETNPDELRSLTELLLLSEYPAHENTQGWVYCAFDYNKL